MTNSTIVAVTLGLVAACGGGASSGPGGSAGGTWGEGPLASRAPIYPPPSEWCVGGDAGSATVVPDPQPGEVECVFSGADGGFGHVRIVAIPGGPADPCTKPGVGDAQHPSCIESDPMGVDGCGAGGVLNIVGVPLSGSVACCCY